MAQALTALGSGAGAKQPPAIRRRFSEQPRRSTASSGDSSFEVGVHLQIFSRVSFDDENR